MIRKNVWPALALACFAASLILMCQIKLKPAYGAPGDGTAMFQLEPESASRKDRISQGLAYDGTYVVYLDDFIYENEDWEIYIYPTVYKLTTAGSIAGSFTAPGAGHEKTTCHKGLAWDGSYIWVSIAGEKKIYKAGSDEAPIITENVYPYDITYAGGYLYEVDGNTGWVYKINTGTGSTVSSFPGPSTTEEKYFGMANDGTYLYIGTYGRNPKIYKYRFDGTVETSYAAPCGHPLGLAYDGTYLWCVDDETEKFWRFEK